MAKEMKSVLIKILAWTWLTLSLVIGLGLFSLIFFISVYIKEVNLLKLVLVDMGVILIGLLFIVLGIGFFELIISLIKIEEKVEEIEEEVGVEEKKIEEI